MNALLLSLEHEIQSIIDTQALGAVKHICVCTKTKSVGSLHPILHSPPDKANADPSLHFALNSHGVESAQTACTVIE